MSVMTDTPAIRPFAVEVPEPEIEALRSRVAATRWPDREGALPLIMTHGWPGSVLEFGKVIGPLADPVAHGGSEADAFHVVVPSIPGHGFSARPAEAGWGPERMARAWATLMQRLGYDQFVAQGGDWGAVITDVLAEQQPPGLLGMHSNMPGIVPPDVAAARQAATGIPAGPVLPPGGAAPPDGLSSARLYWENKFSFFNAKNVTIPAAVSVFPDELYQTPRSWAERAYPNLICYTRLDTGGHFAAWDQPGPFAGEVRAAFRTLR